MQEIEPKTPREKAVKASFGEKLLERYMDILADPATFVYVAECFSAKCIDSASCLGLIEVKAEH